MLFITFGGLSVYDGTRFTNYNRQDGLADDLINDIVEVGPDSLLVATNASKLNTLVRGKVGIYRTADNFYPVINRFLKSSDGSWYVTADDGLYLLQGSRFYRLPLLNKEGIDVGTYLDRIIEWKNHFLVIPWSDNLIEKLIVYDKSTRKVSDIDMDYYNKFDYGFAGGIEVHPFKGLLVGARYNISLGNLYKDPSSYETNGGQPPSFIPQVNVKNNVFQLFVGWIFGNNSSKKKQTQTQPQQ